jgi:hypothetical protein
LYGIGAYCAAGQVIVQGRPVGKGKSAKGELLERVRSGAGRNLRHDQLLLTWGRLPWGFKMIKIKPHEMTVGGANAL